MAVVMVSQWQWTGYMMALFMVAIASIPRDLYEALELEGASKLQTFRHLTVPGVRESTLIFTVINHLRRFQGVRYRLGDDGGGPNHASEVLGTHMYRSAFRDDVVGYPPPSRPSSSSSPFRWAMCSSSCSETTEMAATMLAPRRTGLTPSYVVLLILFWLLTGASVYPLFWLFLSSLKSSPNVRRHLGAAGEWRWSNYAAAWDAGISQYIVSSVIVTVASTILVVFLSQQRPSRSSSSKFRGKPPHLCRYPRRPHPAAGSRTVPVVQDAEHARHLTILISRSSFPMSPSAFRSRRSSSAPIW